MRFFCTY